MAEVLPSIIVWSNTFRNRDLTTFTSVLSILDTFIIQM